MNNIQETLINNLIVLRKSRMLTQIELGEKINYSDKTISKWETGDSCPNIEAIYRLAVFYEVSVDSLLSEKMDVDRKVTIKKNNSKIVISMLAIMAVWIIATIIFVYGSLFSMTSPWMVFIYAVPASCVTGLVFNSLWGNTRANYIIISVLLWTALGAIFVHFLQYGVWVIFLLGVPVQIAIILWSQLKK